jgi:hypothetical protein
MLPQTLRRHASFQGMATIGVHGVQVKRAGYNIKEMKKTVIIIAGIAAIALIAIGAFFLIAKNNSTGGTGSEPTGTLPPASTGTAMIPPVAAPTGTTFDIGTSGGTVSVNNFYKTTPYITQDRLTVVVETTAQYEIIYYTGDSSFIITILSVPFDASRQAAEAAFLSSLGISKQDACKLSVYEGVPADVSDQYVGKQFPLSFCQNGLL